MSSHCSKLQPVTDKIARGVIVPAVEYAHARPVEMHRDRWPAARIHDPVDALLIGQYHRGPVIPAGAESDVSAGEPDFGALGRVLAASEDRNTAGAGDFIVIDRGTDQGVVPGARFAVYRDVGANGQIGRAHV